MFDIDPSRPAESRRAPREPRPSRMPLSQPPPAPRSWWGTIPGQLSLVVMLFGAIVILFGLLGIIGPLSQR
jgi:hypothetical protein